MAQSVGIQASYIFEGVGGMRDQLEQAVLKELQKKGYPLAAEVKGVRSGKGLMGAVMGTKEQCVVIDAADGYTINIANTTVGSYLYVGIYLMTPAIAIGVGAASDWAASVGDVFKLQKLKAYYAAALAATEAAFDTLGLKQANCGYKREA